MSTDIASKARKIIADVMEIDEDDIKGQTDFVQDLGMDSMMALEILAETEKAFKVKIDESKLSEFRNLDQVVKVIGEALAG